MPQALSFQSPKASEQEIDSYIKEAAGTYKVPESWIRAVLNTENAPHDPNAFRYEPKKKASSRGLMQVMPSTAKALGYSGDEAGLTDPKTSINLGAKLIGQLRANTGDDFAAMYSAYNSGSATSYKTNEEVASHVQRAVKNLGDIGGGDVQQWSGQAESPGAATAGAPRTAEGFRQRALESVNKYFGAGQKDLGPMSPAWTDVYSRLDPNMPQKEYDAVRNRYFVDVVRPRVRTDQGFSVQSSYQKFLQDTERPSTISPVERALVKAGQFATAGVKAMAPIIGDQLTASADHTLETIAEREGIESPVLKGVGTLVGMGIGLEALMPAAELAAAKLLTKSITGARHAELIQKVAKGGLAFGVYEALEATDGDRVAAGLRGALIGTTAELAMAPLAAAWRKMRGVGNGANAATDAALEEFQAPPPEKLTLEPSAPRNKRIVITDEGFREIDTPERIGTAQAPPEKPLLETRQRNRPSGQGLLQFPVTGAQGELELTAPAAETEGQGVLPFRPAAAPANTPSWLTGVIDDKFADAQKLGVVDLIESLSAEGKTTRQILTHPAFDGMDKSSAGDAAAMITAVKNKLGIPSQGADEMVKFLDWQKKYRARAGLAPQVQLPGGPVAAEAGAPMSQAARRATVEVPGESPTDAELEIMTAPDPAQKAMRDPTPAEQRAEAVARGEELLARMKADAPGGSAMQDAAAEGMMATVREARRLGIASAPIVDTATKKGARVAFSDASGNVQVLEITKASTDNVIGQVSEALDNGGAIEWFGSHPEARTRLNEFIGYFRDIADEAEATVRITTEPGKSGAVAGSLEKSGIPATATSETAVTASAVKAAPKQAKFYQSAAKKFGQEIKGRISKLMFRAGEIRNELLANGGGKAADYTELHHLRGEIGEELGAGLTRTQIGQLALRFYRRVVTNDLAKVGGEKAALETDDYVLRLFSRHENAGVPFGEKPGLGVRPIPGEKLTSQLEGYKKATTDIADFPEGAPRPGEAPAATTVRGGKVVTVEPMTPEKEAGLAAPKPVSRVRNPSESFVWDAEDQTVAGIPGQLRSRPVGRTKVVPSEALAEHGAAAAVVQTPEGPLRLLTEESTVQDMVHERAHYGDMVTGGDAMPETHAGNRLSTALDLAKAIQKDAPQAYAGRNARQMINEAWAYAVEAIRFAKKGGAEYSLEQLGKWDAGVEGVMEFAHNMATSKLGMAGRQSQDAAVRSYMRLLNDVIRRTSVDVSHALKGGEFTGWTVWHDPSIGKWVMRNGEGESLIKNGLEDVWDVIHGSDISDHFADGAETAYFKKLGGPMFPRPPAETPPTPEVDIRWEGSSAWVVPTMDHAAAVQAKLDAAGASVPYLEKFQAARSAYLKMAPEMDRLGKARDIAMKSASSAKRIDYGEVLATPETEWGRMQAALKLTPSNMAEIRAMKDWAMDLKGQTGIDLIEGLQSVSRARKGVPIGVMPDNIWTRALKNGSVSSTDMNAGRLSQFALRNGMLDKYMKEPLGEIEKLMEIKNTAGTRTLGDALPVMRNYVNYMKGVPDQSQRLLNRFIGGMFSSWNKHVPEALRFPDDLGQPKRVMAMLQLGMYSSGLGARPAVFVRDLASGTAPMSILGPLNYGAGLAKAFTKDGWAKARAAGVTLEGRSVMEALGDVSGDLPAGGKYMRGYVRVADAMMAPTRWGNNIHRVATYLSEESRVLQGLKEVSAGRLPAADMVNRSRSTLWFLDQAPRSRFLAKISAMKPGQEALLADEIARSVNDSVNFGLRMGDQGAALRTGMGRLMGQYGTWPSNYAQFLKKTINRLRDDPKNGAVPFITFVASQIAIGKAAEELGVDAYNWVLLSPLGYGGGPMLENIQNAMIAPEESARGLEARRALHRLPLQMIPGGVQVEKMYNAFESGDVSIQTILGFKTAKEDTLDFDEWLSKESGFSR